MRGTIAGVSNSCASFLRSTWSADFFNQLFGSVLLVWPVGCIFLQWLMGHQKHAQHFVPCLSTACLVGRVQLVEFGIKK